MVKTIPAMMFNMRYSVVERFLLKDMDCSVKLCVAAFCESLPLLPA